MTISQIWYRLIFLTFASGFFKKKFTGQVEVLSIKLISILPSQKSSLIWSLCLFFLSLISGFNSKVCSINDRILFEFWNSTHKCNLYSLHIIISRFTRVDTDLVNFTCFIIIYKYNLLMNSPIDKYLFLC